MQHSATFMVARRRGEVDEDGEGAASPTSFVEAAGSGGERAKRGTDDDGGPLSQAALRSLDSTLDSVETRGPSRAEELAAEAAWNAGEKAREFVSDPDVQDAAKTVAAGAAKAAAWGAKEGGKLAFRAATFAAKQAAKKDGK